MTRASPLAVFEHPRSVALVGASPDPRKWGGRIAHGLLRGRDRRIVHLVNRGGATIEGVASFRSLDDVPVDPELVVLCVPAVELPTVVEHALARGACGLLAVTGAVDRILGSGTEAALAERARAAGARLIGPNSLGLFDATARLEALWGDIAGGSLGIVSESGQVALELAGLAGSSSLGVSRLVSVGSQVDVTAVEMLEDLVDHDATRVVVIYLENFARSRGLVTAVRSLRKAGKPVLLLTVGTSDAGRAAARSHTGAMTPPVTVVDAACRAGGALRVETPTQAVDAATVLAFSPSPRGRRVAIISDSGGQGALAADLAIAHGLVVPTLPARTRERVAAGLPAAAQAGNPVDLAGGGEQDVTSYARVVEETAASGAVDGVVLTGYFGSYSADVPSMAADELVVAKRIAAVARMQLPVTVHSQCASSATVDALRERGVATSRSIERAVSAIANAATAALLPVPAQLMLGPADAPAPVSGYWEARSLLAAVGVPYPPAAIVSTAADVRAAASSMPGPFALKADGLDHKTGHGGIVLGLSGPDDAVVALQSMVDRLGPGRFILEAMDAGGDAVELLVGARWDRAFGPVAVVGRGGVAAEVDPDIAVELGPVDCALALAMLKRLRMWPLLSGWRGARPADLESVARVVAAVSSLCARRPDLAEIEVNPLRAGPGGLVALDAFVGTSRELSIDRAGW